MSKTILCNLSDANKIIDDERYAWTCEVLLALGVSEDIIACENRNEFLFEMNNLGIDVDRYADGCVKIYKKRWYEGEDERRSGWLSGEECLVAEWKNPIREQVVESKEVYYKITLNAWSAIKIGG